MPVHISQAEIAAGVVECQPFVIQAQAVQDGSLKVVNVDRRFGHMKSEVVCCSEREARLYAAAGQPHGERLRMMITSCGTTERWI